MDISSIVAPKKDSVPEPPNVFGKNTEHIGFEKVLLTVLINTIIRIRLLLVCHLNWVRNYEC